MKYQRKGEIVEAKYHFEEDIYTWQFDGFGKWASGAYFRAEYTEVPEVKGHWIHTDIENVVGECFTFPMVCGAFNPRMCYCTDGKHGVVEKPFAQYNAMANEINNLRTELARLNEQVAKLQRVEKVRSRLGSHLSKLWS